MTRAKRPAEPPLVLTRPGETNRQIARIKASLAKRWSLTRMGELFDTVELAWCLVALERTMEARELLSAVIAVPFAGDYNIWTPVASGICLRARLARLASDSNTWQEAMARIREAPAYVLENTDAARVVFDRARDGLEAGYREKSRKWGRHMLGEALSVLCEYEEYGLAGIASGELYDARMLEPLVQLGLDRLRERLEAG